MDEIREAIHSIGLAYWDKPYDAEEEFNPYVYDGSMSPEDLYLVHSLMEQEAADKDTMPGENTMTITETPYWMHRPAKQQERDKSKTQNGRKRKEMSRGCAWSLMLAALAMFWLVVGLACCGAGRADPDQGEGVQIQEVIRAASALEEVEPDEPRPGSEIRINGVQHLAGIDTDLIWELPDEAAVPPDGISGADEVPDPDLVSLGEFVVTAYCACQKCCGKDPSDPLYGITATGTVAAEGRTVAADPEVLPYGTVIYIDGHAYTVEDCGGGIQGQQIDVFFESHEEAQEWGRQVKEVLSK